MPWSSVTAGGSSTTWTEAQGTPKAGMWVPFGALTDAFGGRDFQPIASASAPLALDSTRPIAVWNDSTVISSAFTGEGAP